MTSAKLTKGLIATVGSAVPWLAMACLLVVVAGGASFYHSLTKMEAGDVAVRGNRGEAMGPISALLNAGALFAALWAVHLQRREHHDTSQETRRQLEQLQRTAEAQETLANTQRRAAIVLALATQSQVMMQILATTPDLDADHKALMRASIDGNGQRINTILAALE